MRFFVEPVSLAINYAKTLGYEKIVLVGLSGGGWSTTVAAAIDKRIDLSLPTAGSLPFNMRTSASTEVTGSSSQKTSFTRTATSSACLR